ncbi:MAG: hypothetical protein CMH48_04580 [Muricauda sp.]|nr:DUF2975 domain-containing protein [Allomuricauda sp.]MAU26448.1 hypothetical protein [Allomuricauda sp.]MBC30104.1 hypothetical protein [Allomuricauda sp.]|tara:strand:+ start:645 stop:1160 length:516 start_codon:yes stop_codon:yes gene_type:complete
MKLFGTKSLSHYLFYGSTLAAIGSILLVGFILLSLALGNYTLIENRFQISIPLFPELFIKGFYEQNIIVAITLVMFYFGVFFYVLSLIFKSFKSEKLFTEKVVKSLNRFAILNLVVFPALYIIIHFVVMKKSGYNDIHNLILSLILGVFILFIAAIFKRGLKVQNENDLTI